MKSGVGGRVRWGLQRGEEGRSGVTQMSHWRLTLCSGVEVERGNVFSCLELVSPPAGSLGPPPPPVREMEGRKACRERGGKPWCGWIIIMGCWEGVTDVGVSPVRSMTGPTLLCTSSEVPANAEGERESQFKVPSLYYSPRIPQGYSHEVGGIRSAFVRPMLSRPPPPCWMPAMFIAPPTVCSLGPSCLVAMATAAAPAGRVAIPFSLPVGSWLAVPGLKLMEE